MISAISGVITAMISGGLYKALKGQGLIRFIRVLTRPFKGLILRFKGLIRSLKGLKMLFKGLIAPLTRMQGLTRKSVSGANSALDLNPIGL